MNYDATYKAYALGFLRGFVDGYWDDSYFRNLGEAERHAARAGYDAGVSHYCDVEAPE